MFGKTLTGLMGKKLLGLKLALIGGTGALLLAASAPAQASNVRVGVALNLGGLIGPPTVAYSAPPPAVYTSPPLIQTPPAVYCAPPTVIYQSAPTYYQYRAYHPEFHFWAAHNDHHFAGGGGWDHRFGDRR